MGTDKKIACSYPRSSVKSVVQMHFFGAVNTLLAEHQVLSQAHWYGSAIF
jgi:hypothetical protein